MSDHDCGELTPSVNASAAQDTGESGGREMLPPYLQNADSGEDSARGSHAPALNEEKRRLPASEADTFLEFIGRLTLDEYRRMGAQWIAEKRTAVAPMKPLWYQLLEADVERLRKSLRDREKPGETLSYLALLLHFYHTTLPIMAGLYAISAVTVQGLGIWELMSEGALVPAAKTGAGIAAVIAGLLVLGANFSIARPGRSQSLDSVAKPLWLLPRVLPAAIAGALVQLGVSSFLPSADLRSAEALTAIGVASGIGVIAFVILRYAVKKLDFLKEKDRLYKLRSRILQGARENKARIEKYLARSLSQYPAQIAAEGVLKQRLMSRYEWECRYHSRLMYTFTNFDIFELGSEETQKLFRRWRAMWLTGMAVVGVIAATGHLEMVSAQPVAQILAVGGLLGLGGSWLSLASGIHLSKRKYREAEAVITPRLTDEQLTILGETAAGRDKLSWDDRFEFDDLLDFVDGYAQILERFNELSVVSVPSGSK